MTQNTLALTPENEELNRQLAQLAVEFLDLFTRHKGMVEDESVILNALYLEKLGRFQLELLQKKTEAARLKMKMNLMQAAINRDERPDVQAIEKLVDKKFQDYYAEIEAQAAALDQAKEVLSHLVSKEDTLKLKELFRVLCKRLHPDLHPDQTEDELYCDDIRIGFVPAAMNHVCSRLMDAGKLFVCRVVAKQWIDTWLQVTAHIFMVE